jgi:hypothetical protein
MKEKISKICLIIYIILLIISGFLMTTAGGSVLLFCINGIFAIPPIIIGSKRYLILGVIALIIAVTLAISDYNAGKRDRQKLEARFKQHKKEQGVLHIGGIEGVIFPSGKADFLTRNTRQPNLQSWTPSESDIEKAIPAIKAFLAKQATSIANRLTEYRCQFFGIIVDGKKRIYCNFFHREGHDENWKSTPVSIWDGGDRYFQLEYDIESDQCLDLFINGEA